MSERTFDGFEPERLTLTIFSFTLIPFGVAIWFDLSLLAYISGLVGGFALALWSLFKWGPDP